MMDWKSKLPWIEIREQAALAQVDPNLVAAIVSVESGGDKWAIRYETYYKYRKNTARFARMDAITEKTEFFLQACSIGVMQVMGCKARELGHMGSLLELTDVSIGLKFGCRFLRELSQKYEVLGEIISAYNRGSVLYTSKGEFKNQEYVDKVLKRMKELS